MKETGNPLRNKKDDSKTKNGNCKVRRRGHIMYQEEQFEFRRLKEGDFEDFDALLRYAFQVTSYDMARVGWSDNEMKQSKKPIFDSSYVLGWFYKGRLASQVVVYPMEVNIQGKIFKMGGVTGVATYPEYTGKGLVHALIKQALGHMREQQQSISFLYPYSIPFYRKQGWEIVSDKMTFTIKDTQLPRPQPVEGMMQRVSAMENEDIKNVYKYFSLQRHGALIRADLEWEEYWRWESDDIMAAVYYNREQKPLGYVIYYISREILQIKEIVYLTQEAKYGIWNYISAHFSMANKVEGNNYSGEAIAFEFEDSEISETIKTYYMARIVDVKQFLEEYPFQETGERRDFYLKISDPVAQWNHGVFHLYWQDEKVCCESVEEYEDGKLIELSIGTLTTMMMGYKRPTYLYNNDRLKADWYLVRLLETMIPSEKPYFSDYF